ncbi:MAG TPA: EamA family transporter [Pyrinomonadaceae bacterium]|jgi:drug/metabolite transporter (DMT)-like permease|nr:EamA family transporter [Pyrinomonadaceae bacterium]
MKSRLVWLLLCLIWGSTWLFIKLGLDDLPPFIFAGIRFVIAAAILFVIIKARRLSLPRARADWVLLAITGVLSFSFNYGLVFWGEQYVSSGLAALLQAMIPAFGLVIAHFYLPGERMTPLKISGIVMGVAGVGVVFSNQLTIAGSRALAGCAALVFGSACAAYANVLVKARGSRLDPAILAGGQMVFGLVPLLLAGFLTEGNPLQLHWSRMAVIALFYLAIVGSVVAFLSYYWLVQHMDVTKTMLIALVTPVIAVALGVIVLHEELNWRTFAGGAMIMSGIGLVVLRKGRKQPAELTPTG